MSALDNGKYYAAQAINYEKTGHFAAAKYFYLEAARVLQEAIKNGSAPHSLVETANKYLKRAEKLSQEDENAISKNVKSDEQNFENRVEFLLSEALTNDEAKKYEEALNLYTQGVELCIKCVKEAAKDDEATKNKFRSLCKLALDRAEVIKGILSSELPTFPEVPKDDLTDTAISRDDETNAEPASSDQQPASTSTGNLSQFELKILATTSNINKLQLVPFLKADLKERFAYPIPFTDKDGLLALAEKQKSRLKAWMRPDEFCSEPVLIDKVDSGTIKQNLVSDCSFVASLAISARYERRFNTPLITNIIYPQNKRGEPTYNPCGKYVVKLYINGIIRKVIIDDRLPVGQNGQLLCSYSQNKNELWVSLLEKAYMKVMGGYDFPGSNSNIDLNALTGWIPERVSLKGENFASERETLFEKLFQRFHQGHCLITLATGQLPETEQERSGLVDSHAYAVLDLRKFQEKRLLLLKNPWTHLRWKGRYSEKDQQSWTPELCKALDYSPTDAQQFDDGVFWIDYESVCHFFDVFYVNWNPKLFPFTYSLHNFWHAGHGPIKDLYTIADNPQYSLVVDNKTGTTAVWILLSRHIMEKNDFADNKEYITVIVYQSGKKIYLPNEPKPLIDGARINSPHYLCQLKVTEPGVNKYTLVVAQYEKTNTIYYTLRAYSSASFKLTEIKSALKTRKTVNGEWKGQNAGGCGNGTSRDTVKNNPIIQVKIDDGSDDNTLLIDLRAPVQFSIGFEVKLLSACRRNQTFESKSTGIFRYGCTVLELEHLPAGTYDVQVMTFQAGQEGPFILAVQCSTDFSLKRVQ
ncbi:hypothetical protein M3Y97_00888000 [Aphelenchoides bicaudatus]|nr:hypothetical protein M3Y97_00888000 [Aphelenchoides bicaudatus]